MTPPPATGLPDAHMVEQAKKTVTTIFGDIPYQQESIMHFPQGILGFPYNKEYILVDIQHPNAPHFILLQPLEVTAHSFLVLPLKKEGGLIPKEDLNTALKHYGIPTEDAEVFVIGTFKKEGETLKRTLNLNAPIFVNFKHKLGLQHVFTGKNFDMQHPLGAAE